MVGDSAVRIGFFTDSYLPALHGVDLIRRLWDALAVPTKLCLQSELGVGGRGADLLADTCEALKAGTCLALTVAAKAPINRRCRC